MSSPALNEALTDTSRGTSGGRRQGWLRGVQVVSEVALACMLLIGAGLLTRSFLRLLDVEPGFRPEGAVAVGIDLRRSSFASEDQRIAYYEEALRRVNEAPGVEAAGLTDVLPFAFNRLWGITVPAQENPRDEPRHAYVRIVSEGYLHAMGIPLRAGRDFDAGDNASARPVILGNEILARGSGRARTRSAGC